MKILFLLSLLFSFIHPVMYFKASVQATSYAIMNIDTHEMIEGSNVNNQRSVASISKIMTAILALESDDLFTTVVVDETIDLAVGSSLYLEKGTQVTIYELVYGLLLRSGNDASHLIAECIGGSIEKFVIKMNEKAEELNMVNTLFNNPSGLDIYDEGNISTAYDMGLLICYCMENPLYRKMTSSKSFKSASKGWWRNKNKLLLTYENCTGGKTGYTKKAKRTLITTACYHSMHLAMITLNCGNDFYIHRAMYEYYFNNLIYVKFLNKGKNYVLNYVFEVKKSYGYLLSKDLINGGSLVYNVNLDSLMVSLSYRDDKGNRLELGRVPLLSFKKM